MNKHSNVTTFVHVLVYKTVGGDWLLLQLSSIFLPKQGKILQIDYYLYCTHAVMMVANRQTDKPMLAFYYCNRSLLPFGGIDCCLFYQSIYMWLLFIPHIQEHCCVLYTIVGWDSIVGEWSRVEGHSSDPDPNDPYGNIHK